MHNVFFCVGELYKDFELKEIDGKKYAVGVIKVKDYDNTNRPQNNLEFYISEGIYNNIDNKIKVGDSIGLRSTIIGTDHGIIVNADRITFLQSEKSVEESKNNEMER